MPQPDLSVVLPTCPVDPRDRDGLPHPDLFRALASCVQGLAVELVVGVDGGAPKVVDAVDAWAEHAPPGVRVVRFVTRPTEAVTWGNAVRNYALEERLATGRYIAWQDHDDAFVPGALAQVVAELDATDSRPGLFRMRVHHWTKRPVVLPIQRTIARGSVGGHMLVTPNEPELLGRWAPETEYTADFEYVRETTDRFAAAGRPVFWSSTVISDLRPKR